MKNFLKGKIFTGVIVFATFILAGIAIYTAIRLYQLRSQPVAPNVPSSNPAAATLAPQVKACSLAFAISVSTASPTPTPTPTPPGSGTPTPTGTPTAPPSGTPNSCGGTCGSNSNCSSNLVCYNGYCRNPSCTTSTNCVCGTSPTPTPPTLPSSGTDWPTVASAGIGILVIVGSLIIAL